MSPYLAGPGPVAIAHRGGGLEAPENSRAAVEHVVALGLRYLETDVRATSDGVPVLMHDPTVDRTTDGSGAVAELTWDQVSRLRDASGAPPLRLADVLADHPRLRLNLDAKDERAVAPMARVIRAAGAQDRVCVASFDDRRVRDLRAALDGRVCSSLGRQESARLVLAARLPRAARRRVLAHLPGPEQNVLCVQVPERFRGVPVVTSAFVSVAHEHGLAVHVWTVDEVADMERLLDLGVDGLVSDRPTRLREVLQARGPWH
ncbi:glycerophosphodiester phosphodiesterase [Georgenia sp. 10Sc9-8]|uniref:Glycerophosphodiester phosphodiesterase n=1 Tax=Georgenia halotolerans TaxID=3028317 RepID=A0ABT5TZW0_9MICO|nr:glycerophosphodiester phosphodiesterase [Georgenia halotolerans]